MANSQLTAEERQLLLKIAHKVIEESASGQELTRLELSSLPHRLQEQGASFVTLTINENLRGCIGTLQAYQPLALDVQEHAVAAAMEDHRFPQVTLEEVPLLTIEISRLTPSQPLEYSTVDDLLSKLRPGVDGVVLRYGFQRATFLPQVWEKTTGKEDFLTQLCLKMGAHGDLWRHKHLQVQVYQVEEFKEGEK